MFAFCPLSAARIQEGNKGTAAAAMGAFCLGVLSSVPGAEARSVERTALVWVDSSVQLSGRGTVTVWGRFVCHLRRVWQKKRLWMQGAVVSA